MQKVTKIPRKTNKKREFENESTKKRFLNTDSKRSTADVGGNQVTRGLEQQALIDIQIEGELGEFIKVMRVLQDFPEVQYINIIHGSLKEFSDTKRFVYLSDGVTERKYVIAEVELLSGKSISIMEIEREDKSVATLIYFRNNRENKLCIYRRILMDLINTSGSWRKEVFRINNIDCISLRHGKSNVVHRANLIFNKL